MHGTFEEFRSLNGFICYVVLPGPGWNMECVKEIVMELNDGDAKDRDHIKSVLKIFSFYVAVAYFNSADSRDLYQVCYIPSTPLRRPYTPYDHSIH